MVKQAMRGQQQLLLLRRASLRTSTSTRPQQPPVRRRPFSTTPPTTTPSNAAVPPPAAEAPPLPPPLPDVPVVAPAPGSSHLYKAAAVVFGIGTGYAIANVTDQSLGFLWPNPNRDATARGFSTEASVTNWSATHAVEPKKYYEPNDMEELELLVRDAHAKGQRIRPVGTALSPNGLGMDKDGMVCLSHLDKVLEVDRKAQTVTVQAGARVSQVLEALGKHGLTLQNFSSIQEQQLGGWTQVAAHGTGASLPTVEEQIVRMKLVTPASGVIELSETQDPELFRLAKVGLGALGIVSELTLKCIPQHELLEKTYVVNSLKELKKDHHRLLREYRHVRYMWLPHTDSIVVVISNPYEEGVTPLPPSFHTPPTPEPTKLAPIRSLLLSHPACRLSATDAAALGFTELRDALLDLAPLDPRWVGRVNAAEAKYWKVSEGYRKGGSTEILGFDCGGQQWVLEVAFPIGRIPKAKEGGKKGWWGWGGKEEEVETRDLEFVDRLRRMIREKNLPAPCPIEQRWTASSNAGMSPASSKDKEEVFSWVGVIMYLPPGQGEGGREEIGRAFRRYVGEMEHLCVEFGAFPHWAKIEVPGEEGARERLKARLAARYPVAAFNIVRKGFDPKGVLGNEMVERLFAEGGKER